MRFSGKKAIVTGGTGALGAVVVQQLLDEGAQVAVPVHHKLPEPIASGEAASKSQPAPFFIPANLLVQDEVNSFFKTVVDSWQGVDFLINCAGGYAGGKRVEEAAIADWDAMLDANFRTALLMCRAALPIMRERRFGRIITIGAMAALNPSAGRGPYQVSKRALVALTETIAEEVKGSGITANAIIPSTILTPSNAKSMPDADTSKWVPPSEIGSLILYLCSSDARSMNGNIIKIYGGG